MPSARRYNLACAIKDSATFELWYFACTSAKTAVDHPENRDPFRSRDGGGCLFVTKSY